MIPHNLPTIGIEEESAALRVLRSGWLAQGSEVEAFENEFCKFLGLPDRHAVAVSSGTSALFLALWVSGAKNKSVSFPGYVCSALRHAVNMAGSTESITDIANDSPNVDPKKIENNEISIIPHMYGIPVDLDYFKSTHIIEDCAQALGAKINGISVGLHGESGIFSFYVTKLMTAGGQGGMFVSKKKDLVDAVRDYREFDYRRDAKKRFNFQMTDLQAAIGREQLKKLPKFLARREEIFQKYKSAGLDLLDVKPSDTHLSPVRYRAVMKTKEPRKVIDSLESHGVKTIVPTEDWELLGEHNLLPNALKLSRETVSLPIYPSLSEEQVETIISMVLSK
jgi:perosamine synthetase